MKSVTLLESVEDIINAAQVDRAEGEKRPYMSPTKNTLIVDKDGYVTLDSDKNEFVLGNRINFRMLVTELGRRANISIAFNIKGGQFHISGEDE